MSEQQINLVNIEFENKPKCNSGICDITKRKSNMKRKIPFWANDPNILFQQPYILEFFPVESMTYEQKLNAVTRTVIVLTVISFLYTHSTRLLAVSAVTILAIFLLHYAHEQSKPDKINSDRRLRFNDLTEGFGDADGIGGHMEDDHGVGFDNTILVKGSRKLQREKIIQDMINPPNTFVKPEMHNPFGNVLLTDYDFNPNKKPAPPSYTEQSSDEILKQAKKLVVEANPGQPNIANKLFNDLGDELVFEQSMRPFYSTANTTIPNDQGGFADFCYGGMVSSKEGNKLAMGRNMPRYNLY